MTTSATQESAPLEDSVAVDLKTLSTNGSNGSGEGSDILEQPILIDEAPSGDTEASAEQPESSDTEEETAASDPAMSVLEGSLAKLEEHLGNKASQDETKSLEATIESLRELIEANESRAQREREESQVKAQQSLNDFQGRVAALKSDLANLDRTVTASRAQEQVGPGAVPPEVLQQVYEEILTEILQEINRLSGAAGPGTALRVLESVRKSNSGTEFFRVEDDKRIVATGLAQAVQRGLLSPFQVHLTFGEFRRQLSAQVPLYRERGFEELVGARTSAYSVATIRRLVEQASDLEETLGGITGRLDILEANVKQITDSTIERG